MPIEGIFFENQILTAQGLGAFGDAALSDGILTGCEVSYSNHGFSVSEGYIVVRGRVIKVGANTRIENVTVGTSAVAYTAVIATVDTTQGSTEESFNQVSFSVAQGTSISAITQVTSLDINLTGRSASAVMAIVDTSGSSPEVKSYMRSVGKSLTNLWERSPAAMAETTILLPSICAFDAILISYRVSVLPDETKAMSSVVCPFSKGSSDSVTFNMIGSWINDSNSNVLYQRQATINSAAGTIKFSNSWWKSSASSSSYGTATSLCVPVTIYGMAMH